MAIAPQRQKRYVLKDVLGKGGMGVVYRAYDNETRRDVTLKTLLNADDRTMLDLFRKEWQVLATLNHPNIVDVYDIGEMEDDEGRKPYFVMPLLPGSPLDKVIKDASHRLTVDRVIDIITQTCRGLHAAHERGLVHRDIKPSNLFILDDDSVKIIDFGVAHFVDSRTVTSLKGTLHYMAPEQVQMQNPTPLSDLFSLAVVCYEAFCRRRPFEGASAEQLREAILREMPPPVSDLNPSVTRVVSQVIHKALAKQAWHRFGSVREFGDNLLKAGRNEPLTFFDEGRISARIQRAQKAFETGDLEFAHEVISGLESESYIHPDIPKLRRQVDQAVRSKTIRQLLEIARRYFDAEEYQLALPKISEVLQLEPANTDALTLRAEIEGKRTTQQAAQWMSLAQQHLENHSFSHARQALENVLQIKPNDTQARKLLLEINLQEQEYTRLKQQRDELFHAALEAKQKGDLSTALSDLRKVIDINRRAPGTATPERAASVENAYQEVLSEYEALRNGYEQARAYLGEKNFKAALTLCDEFLAKYPGHALFQGLRVDVEERARQELSAVIAKIDRQVENEADLDRRVGILRQAVEEHPDESHFQRALHLATSKRDLVNATVARARTLEERGQFTEALNQWDVLRTIHGSYPGLEFEVERLQVRREQQSRAEAKQRWVDQIDGYLSLGDWSRAQELVRDALFEFPQDAELNALQKLATQAGARASEAQALLEEAAALTAESRFEEAVTVLRRATELDPRNSAVRSALVDTLLKEVRRQLPRDLQAAGELLNQTLELDRDNPLAKSFLTLVEDRKRAEIVERCLGEARQFQAEGELDRALTTVNSGLTIYPEEPRLTALKASLERSIAERPGISARNRDLDDLRAVEREAAAVSNADELQTMLDRTMSVAVRYEGDRDFESIVQFLRGRIDSVEQEAPPSLVAAAPEVPAVPQPAPPQPAVQPPPAPPESAAPVQRRSGPGLLQNRLLWAFGGFVVLIAIIAGAVALLRPSKQNLPNLSLVSEPAGATIFVDGKPIGQAPTTFVAPPGEHTLRAELEGYQAQESSVNAVADRKCCDPITLAPLRSVLRFWTDIPAATLTLDGQDRGVAVPGEPLEIAGIEPGEHTLTMTSPDGKAEVKFQTFIAKAPEFEPPGAPKGLRMFLLSVLGKRGRFQGSAPSKVGWDGAAFSDVAPQGAEFSDLQQGTQQLSIDEGNGSIRKAPVVMGAAPALNAFIVSGRAFDFGSLLVRTNESDVTILVDGRKRRFSQMQEGLMVSAVTVGRHKLEIQKPGYRPALDSETVQILPGKTAEVNVTLTPMPTQLSIEGAIRGTQVVLGGKVVGSVGSGTFTTEPPLGAHTVELRRRGYRSRSVNLTFAAGVERVIGPPESVLDRLEGVLILSIKPARNVTMKVDPVADVVDYSGPRELTELPSTLTLPTGTYNLTFSSPGYETEPITVQLVDGETKRIPISLKKR